MGHDMFAEIRANIKLLEAIPKYIHFSPFTVLKLSEYLDLTPIEA
jgi:hypothetical protein